MLRRVCQLLLVLVPSLAVGADGVREINQAAVLAAGGFPYTISEPGSYQLTGNLSVPADTSGIVITSDDVVLDLAEFSIRGQGGTGGIGIDGAAALNQVIRNGTIAIMGGTGVRTGSRSRVERIHAVQNGGDGIATGNRSRVVDCTASINGEDGIDASSQNLVRGSTSRGNAGDGIELALGSVALDNIVLRNGGDGINGNGNNGSIALRNVVNSNRRNGIALGLGCLALSNLMTLDFQGDSTLLLLGSSCGYSLNLMNTNSGTGATLSGGVDLSFHGASNVCDTNTNCP